MPSTTTTTNPPAEVIPRRVVNGALTARVGLAAMELCRPLPFEALERPAVSSLVSRALSGLFGKGDR